MLTNDEIIDVRDALIAKGDLASLSVHDQNLYRDCDIALGVVRCTPATREEARARVSSTAPAAAATDLRWVSWNQHGDVEHEPDCRPVTWPPPPEVLAFWGTGGGGGEGSDAYCTVVALVRAQSEETSAAIIQAAWSPGIGEWRFNHAYGKDTPPGDRFPVPSWSVKMQRWPWKTS